MPTFDHPSYLVKREGTYIVKNTRLNKYVLYSDFLCGETVVKLYGHDDIINEMSQNGISDSDLSFTVIDDTYSSTFLEA